jgi:flagellar basal-body rod protein FlgF
MARRLLPGLPMDPLLISAASGMKARMESLDMLSNNLANTGTAGFKADRELHGLYKDALPWIERHWTDFSQGDLLPTGNPLDLGLKGKGFFSLNSPSGIVYTRGGEFRLSKANQIETLDGFTLRDRRNMGQPIVVDPQVPISIGQDGVVRQAGQELAQIETVSVDQASIALRKQGNSYFALASASAPVAAAEELEIHQGSLEQSNVPAGDVAVRLVSVMRQFEMLQRALSLGADMNRRAIEEVAKPG